MMAAPTIHHGTPMAPRAALLDVCEGRAMCVSFFRPDDAEAVERISPAIMFRQRRVFVLAAGRQTRRGMGPAAEGLATLLRMARTALGVTKSMGGHTGRAGSAQPAQRRASERLAVRSHARRSPLAHGWASGAPGTPVRAVRPRSARLDRRPEDRACRLRSVSSPHGRGIDAARRALAENPHDARGRRGLRLPVRVGGQHVARTERVAL
jgi:hypothetical protein